MVVTFLDTVLAAILCKLNGTCLRATLRCTHNRHDPQNDVNLSGFQYSIAYSNSNLDIYRKK